MADDSIKALKRDILQGIMGLNGKDEIPTDRMGPRTFDAMEDLNKKIGMANPEEMQDLLKRYSVGRASDRPFPGGSSSQLGDLYSSGPGGSDDFGMAEDIIDPMEEEKYKQALRSSEIEEKKRALKMTPEDHRNRGKSIRSARKFREANYKDIKEKRARRNVLQSLSELGEHPYMEDQKFTSRTRSPMENIKSPKRATKVGKGAFADVYNVGGDIIKTPSTNDRGWGAQFDDDSARKVLGGNVAPDLIDTSSVVKTKNNTYNIQKRVPMTIGDAMDEVKEKKNKLFQEVTEMEESGKKGTQKWRKSVKDRLESFDAEETKFMKLRNEVDEKLLKEHGLSVLDNHHDNYSYDPKTGKVKILDAGLLEAKPKNLSLLADGLPRTGGGRTHALDRTLIQHAKDNMENLTPEEQKLVKEWDKSSLRSRKDIIKSQVSPYKYTSQTASRLPTTPKSGKAKALGKAAGKGFLKGAGKVAAQLPWVGPLVGLGAAAYSGDTPAMIDAGIDAIDPTGIASTIPTRGIYEEEMGKHKLRGELEELNKEKRSPEYFDRIMNMVGPELKLDEEQRNEYELSGSAYPNRFKAGRR